MSPELLTAIGGLLVSLITVVIAPLYIKRRTRQNELDATDLQSWQSVTAVLQTERNDLKKRVSDVEAQWQARIDRMQVEHDRQMDAAKARIRQLEEEVAELYRRFYGNLPPRP